MSNVKRKVEAVLFSSGNKLSVEEIRKLCRAPIEEVKQALQELKKEYEENNSSIMIIEDGDFWKFSVRDQFIPIVRKIVTQTELSKSVLETLAVIAFKYPILQSDLIKIRTNKAYEHLVELEKSGYITRQKYSRTNLIKLTDKFFQYFDLTPEKLTEEFKSFEGIAKAIKNKEAEVEIAVEQQKKAAEEARKQDDKIKEDIEKLDKEGESYSLPVQVYDASPEKEDNKEMNNTESESENKKEKLGELDVVEESEEGEQIEESESKIDEEEEKYGEDKSEVKEEDTKNNEKEDAEENEEEKKVDDEVEKMTHPKE